MSVGRRVVGHLVGAGRDLAHLGLSPTKHFAKDFYYMATLRPKRAIKEGIKGIGGVGRQIFVLGSAASALTIAGRLAAFSADSVILSLSKDHKTGSDS